MKHFIFVFLFFWSIVGKSQDCQSLTFIKDTAQKVSVKGNVTWLKFRAKGGAVKMAIKDVLGKEDVSYEIYNFKDCGKTQGQFVRPIRIIKTGVTALTKEVWDYALDQGRCVCNHCLKSITVSPSDVLKLKQENYYLLKIITQASNVQISFNWSSVDPSKKVFALGESSEGLEVGMIYQLKTVQFIASRTAFLNMRTPAELDSLANFLLKNKTLTVNIVGHVNGPFNTNPSGFQKLSTARAERVKDILIKKGIAASRLKHEGKSNKMMRYPKPKTEWEAQQNRRVEVVITSL